jgi:hypothetical protein
MTPDTRAAAAMNDNSQSRILVRAADHFWLSDFRNFDLGDGLLLNGLHQLEDLTVGACTEVLQYAVDQVQGQGDILLVHVFLHAVADKGQRRNPRGNYAAVAQGVPVAIGGFF